MHKGIFNLFTWENKKEFELTPESLSKLSNWKFKTLKKYLREKDIMLTEKVIFQFTG